MKQKQLLSGIILILVIACSNNTVPDRFHQETEQILRQEGELTPFSGSELEKIDWSTTAEHYTDSTVYPFHVNWNRNDQTYPFPYRLIIKGDSIHDLQDFNYLINSWTSVITPEFDPKDHPNWKELKDIAPTISLNFNKSELVCLDSIEQTYLEYFMGNVSMIVNDDTLFADTMVWNPFSESITARSVELHHQHEDESISIIKGELLTTDPLLTNYRISNTRFSLEDKDN